MDKAVLRNFVIEIVRRCDTEPGFKVLPRRWVVERTFGWMTRWRRLVRDYEERVDCSEAMIHVALGACSSVKSASCWINGLGRKEGRITHHHGLKRIIFKAHFDKRRIADGLVLATYGAFDRAKNSMTLDHWPSTRGGRFSPILCGENLLICIYRF
mgnify:FL=1